MAVLDGILKLSQVSSSLEEVWRKVEGNGVPSSGVEMKMCGCLPDEPDKRIAVALFSTNYFEADEIV